MGVADGGKLSKDEEKICDMTNSICYLSYVEDTKEKRVLSLEAALSVCSKRATAKNSKLYVRYDEVSTISINVIFFYFI